MGNSDRTYGDCPVKGIAYEEEKRMGSKMKEKLHTGEIYYPSDDEIMQEQFQCQEKMYDYNSTRPSEGENRHINITCLFILEETAGWELVLS